MKKLVSLILMAALFISCCAFSVVAADEITVLVNGEKLVADVPAQAMKVFDENGGYVGDRVMLPLRAVGEKLNSDVWWNDETCGITIYRKNDLVIMWEGRDTAFCMDGLSLSKGYKMDIPPTIIDSRTLVPVRAVAELLGATVDWIEETSTVDIKLDLGELENNAGTAEECEIYEVLIGQDYETYKSYANGTIETVTGKIVLTTGEEIGFDLYPKLAPITCEKFISLAKSGFYNGTFFHDIAAGKQISGGYYIADEEDSTSVYYNETETIVGEFIMNGKLNLIPHKRGTITMLRDVEEENSAKGQFAILCKEYKALDGYTAGFGVVTYGMEIVEKISNGELDEYGWPKYPVVIKEVIINE